MRYVSPIDPHVHLRGTEYHEDYLRMAVEDAKAVGLSAFLEMPNPVPQLTTFDTVTRRCLYVGGVIDEVYPSLYHAVNVGLTNDLELTESILSRIQNGPPGFAADKVFYTHSTGNMGILDPDIQKKIWKIKGKMGYDKVSIGHFEDEKVFSGSFDPTRPVTHSFYQCPQAELVQVETQLKYAMDAGFRGTFYVAHVSNPETIELLTRERSKLPFSVVIEATWHHIFLNHHSYKLHGNRVKMNPPLRSEVDQRKLLEAVLRGNVDVIGTDHAPHPLVRKDDPLKPASGIPGIAFWPMGLNFLRWNGMSREMLNNVSFYNAKRIFNLPVTPFEIDKEYDPILWQKYGFNPFSVHDSVSLVIR